MVSFLRVGEREDLRVKSAYNCLIFLEQRK